MAVVVFLLTIGASLTAASPTALSTRQRADYAVRIDAARGLHDGLFGIVDQLVELDAVETAQVVTYADVQIETPQTSLTQSVAIYALEPNAAGVLFDVQSVDGDVAAVDGSEVAVRDRVASETGGPSATLSV